MHSGPHKKTHEFRANSGQNFDNRSGRDGVICEQVLNTPLTAECRTRQTCGIFTSIGFQWPGSVIVEQQPAMAKASGRLLAVFKYLAAL